MQNNIEKIQAEQDAKVKETALQMFKSGDDISISLIQRKCKAGYNSAYRVFEDLIKTGIVKRGIKYGYSTFI